MAPPPPPPLRKPAPAYARRDADVDDHVEQRDRGPPGLERSQVAGSGGSRSRSARTGVTTTTTERHKNQHKHRTRRAPTPYPPSSPTRSQGRDRDDVGGRYGTDSGYDRSRGVPPPPSLTVAEWDAYDLEGDSDQRGRRRNVLVQGGGGRWYGYGSEEVPRPRPPPPSLASSVPAPPHTKNKGKQEDASEGVRVTVEVNRGQRGRAEEKGLSRIEEVEEQEGSVVERDVLHRQSHLSHSNGNHLQRPTFTHLPSSYNNNDHYHYGEGSYRYPYPYEPTRYISMLLALDGIPRLHNLISAFSTWILLAGFVLFPGTFASLSKGDNRELGDGPVRRVLEGVGMIPIIILAWVCCAIGTIGILWLWWRWALNYVWLVNRLFFPGTLNSLAGLISILASVYGIQGGVFSTNAKIAAIVTGASMVLFGLLTAWYSWVKLRGVRKEHEAWVEYVTSSSSGGGGQREMGTGAERERERGVGGLQRLVGKKGEGFVQMVRRKAMERQLEAGMLF